MRGTGKSTLVHFLIEELGIDSEDIAFACYTGKAALVLREKGENAVTLHKLLYHSIPLPNGSFIHKPRKDLDKAYKLIIIDEVSMCPKEIWTLALSHHVHIIALGDPFQLPPIGTDNGVLKNPHVFLDEVVRQALESDIIKLSMHIRAGKPLEPFIGKDVRVYDKNHFYAEMYTWADQVLVGRNTTRQAINKRIREILGRGKDPEQEDKVICLKNYWQTINDDGLPLINGSIGTLGNVILNDNKMIADYYPDGQINDSNKLEYLQMDYGLFATGTPTPVLGKVKPENEKKQFDYGYAITVHKSQGSQFSKVLLFEEVLNTEMHARWLYTAITRAVDRLIIIMK